MITTTTDTSEPTHPEHAPLLHPEEIPTWKAIIRNTLKVTGPLVIANTCSATLDFLANNIISHQDPDSLAAAALITSTQVTILVVSSGLLLTVGNFTSEAAGAKHNQEVGIIYRQSQLIAGLSGILIIPLFYHAAAIQKLLGQRPELITITQDYFRSYMYAAPAELMLIASQQFASGLRKQPFILAVSIINPIVFYLLGRALANGQGIQGVGYAYIITNWSSWLAYQLYFHCHANFKNFSLRAFSSLKNELDYLRSLLANSFPVSLMLGGELGAFFMLNTFAGHLSKEDIQTHNIVLQYVLLSLVPLIALSESASILVGESLGTNQLSTIRRYAGTHLALGLAMASLSLILFTCLPKTLASLFIDIDEEESSYINSTLKWVFLIYAIGQIFEAIRHTSLGTLRGIHDTMIPMIINFISLWFVAVPLAFILSKYTDMRIPGIALGDSFGSIGSLFLLYRCYKKTTHDALSEIANENEAKVPSSFLDRFSFFRNKNNNNKQSKNKKLSDYITKIAKPGGYLSCASDQPPGNIVITP